MKHNLGIVILNYNTPNDVEKCIDSIRKYCTESFRIYLVDNCSTDNSVEYFNRVYEGSTDVIILKSDINRGFSAGNNLGGFAAAKDGMDLLLFTNSDIEFKESSISAMREVLSSPHYDDVGIVGPRIETPDSDSSEFARKRITLNYYLKTKKPFCYFVSNKFNKRYQKITFDDHNVFTFEGMVSGCCLMMKTKLFVENKGFDESLFLYGEEDIWAYKLAAIGLKAAIAGKSVVFHNHHNSIKKRGLAFTRFYQWLSPLIVIKAYGTYSTNLFKIVCICNLLTWDMCSVFSEDYRKMRTDFRNHIIKLMKE